MKTNAMGLKAKIRNIAKGKNMSAQVVLQNYLFERFLERLSVSEYKDKFILKGGILIAALVGIDNRATMDMDTTVKDFPLNIDSIRRAISAISNVSIDDNVKFTLRNIDAIREDDPYGGYRVSIVSNYETIVIPMHIDITTGDVITPKEILYSYKMLFEDRSINIWAYNIETVLAEKVETIFRRGELNTRPRDFYDIYILTKTQVFNDKVFKEALELTAEHRDTTHILVDIEKRLQVIENSESLLQRWHKYTKSYRYAEKISYSDIIGVLKMLMQFSL